MNSTERNAYFTRNRVLKALSDDEIASVSTAETADRLDNGDEYLDLEHLELGVRQADAAAAPMGRVLPRKSVHAKTWSKLLASSTPSRARIRPLTEVQTLRAGAMRALHAVLPDFPASDPAPMPAAPFVLQRQ